MTYIIAQPCVDILDKSCIEECPVDCIYEGERMLYIHPDECVDCGACEPVCPVEAIFYEDDVPDQWKDFYKANVEFFDGPRLAWRCLQGRQDQQGPPDRDGACLRREKQADPGGTAAPVSLGSARSLRPEGPGPSGRDRGPVRGHPRGSCPGAGAGRSPGRGQRSRVPGHARHPGAARGGGRLAGPRPRGHGRAGRGAAADRHEGVHRLAAGPARLRPRRRGRLPGTGLPDLRHRRPAGGRRRCGARTASPPLGPEGVRLVWVNSPSNPTGRVLPAEHLAKMVALGAGARRGARLRRVLHRASAGTPSPVSVLHPDGVRRVVSTGCSRCTRCPSGPTWPATGRASSPATPR